MHVNYILTQVCVKKRYNTRMAKVLDFNPQFQKALDLLENSGKHIFITGRAGTGKSTLLQYFRDHTKKNIVVLAPTGVAAVNIEGQTIHSFFRFKPGVTLKEARGAAKKCEKMKIFHKLECVVIDEISMVRADLLDCVNEFLKTIRKNKLAFGGVQMIFFGDLYQLPPVVTSSDREIFRTVYASPYFFDAKVASCLLHDSSSFEFLELEKIYRQSDPKFIELLNSIRNKSFTEEHIAAFNRRFIPETNGNKSGLCPNRSSAMQNEGGICLTSTNAQADEINFLNLQKLKTKSKKYQGEIEGKFEIKDLPTDLELVLKPGARAMLLNNDRAGRWINGTLGTIVSCTENYVEVKLDNGEIYEVGHYMWEMLRFNYNVSARAIEKETVGSFTQIPLRLAWAVTIHKAQGKTFEKVTIDVGRGTFAPGQMYVALSRGTCLEGLTLKQPLKKSHVMTDWRVSKFLTNFQYAISEKSISKEDKIALIKKAIIEKNKLQITYLKAKDEKSRREILPLKVELMEFKGYEFMGVEAFCFTRGESRVFRVEKILEMKIV